MRNYYLKNRDAVNVWRRNYYNNDGRIKILLTHAKRRAEVVSTSDSSITKEVIKHLFVEQEGKCIGCDRLFKEGKNSFHIDHITPLIEGGKHTKDNIQLLCPMCNLQKGRKNIIEHTRGRPTKYDPEMLIPALEKMMRDGATIEEYCTAMDINDDTFNEWVKKYPEFSASKKKAEQYAYSWWLKNGRINLENKQFNYVGFYMQMKNRFGWRDKRENTYDKDTLRALQETIYAILKR